MTLNRDVTEAAPVRIAIAARRPVLAFFAVTFAWSWGYWALVGSFVPRESIHYLVTLPGLWGPVVGAIAVTWATGRGVRRFLRRTLGRPRPRWLVIALVAPVAIGTIAPLVQIGMGEAGAGVAVVGPIVGLLVAIVAGGSEEVGLRGFAHPRLRERYDGLLAGLLVGVPWIVWHLPLIALGVGFGGSFAAFAAATLALSVLLGWLYDASGSALAPVVAHAGIDAPSVVSTTGSASDDVALVAAIAVVALYWLLVAGLLARNGRHLAATRSPPVPTSGGG